MSTPSSRASMVAHDGKTLGKVTKFEFIPNNYILKSISSLFRKPILFIIYDHCSLWNYVYIMYHNSQDLCILPYFIYVSIRAFTPTKLNEKSFSNNILWMSIPYSRVPMVVVHVGRMLIKVTKYGHTHDNCILLKVFRALLENPFCTYPTIISIYKIAFQWHILLNNSPALSKYTSCAYLMIIVVHETMYAWHILSNNFHTFATLP